MQSESGVVTVAEIEAAVVSEAGAEAEAGEQTVAEEEGQRKRQP
jgi:hypothetical protein